MRKRKKQAKTQKKVYDREITEKANRNKRK